MYDVDLSLFNIGKIGYLHTQKVVLDHCIGHMRQFFSLYRNEFSLHSDIHPHQAIQSRSKQCIPHSADWGFRNKNKFRVLTDSDVTTAYSIHNELFGLCMKMSFLCIHTSIHMKQFNQDANNACLIVLTLASYTKMSCTYI